MSGKLFATSFGLFMIAFQSLLACSQPAIFIGLSESFSTLLIANFLDISFAFFFHRLEFNYSGLVRQAALAARREPPN